MKNPWPGLFNLHRQKAYANRGGWGLCRHKTFTRLKICTKKKIIFWTNHLSSQNYTHESLTEINHFRGYDVTISTSILLRRGLEKPLTCEIVILVRPFFRRWVMLTGVFLAWACATAEQAMCMKAHHRVCLHQNSASQSYHDRDYFARWSWRMCSWFKKMWFAKTNLTLSQKRSRPALTYHELLSNFISRLDLDNGTRICSACRIALTSSKSKQSDETFVDVSKHFQVSLFWNGKGRQILKKNIANLNEWVRRWKFTQLTMECYWIASVRTLELGDRQCSGLHPTFSTDRSACLSIKIYRRSSICNAAFLKNHV